MNQFDFDTGVNNNIVTMTNWHPMLGDHRRPRYRAIADALADDVRSGVLPPGARLPTHRDLAWRLRVTVGTVSRAYAEAERRGLIAGEVGRGTFVRFLGGSSARARRDEAPAADFIDLSVNRPRVPSERARLAAALEELAAAPELAALLDYLPLAGRAGDRAQGAQWLARNGLAARPEEVIVTAGAQHAMACVFAAIAKPGDTIAAEALTYPGLRSLAAFLHLRLAPLAMDDEGLLPEALEAACRAGPVRAVYILPNLHNPTTATLPLARRHALAEIVRRHDVLLVEDDIYGFLRTPSLPPLASLVPEQAFYIDATSKSLMPTLRIGYVRAPLQHVDDITAALRATTYSAPPLMAQIASRWIEDGTADQLVAEKRAEAAHRQESVRKRLAGCDYRGDPAATHLWLILPGSWSAEDFAAAARRRGVGVTPAAAFALTRHAPNAVRVCIGTPPTLAELDRGLRRLTALLAEAPETYLSVV
jgi:DNA-binding transcriptional MocR family regulator